MLWAIFVWKFNDFMSKSSHRTEAPTLTNVVEAEIPRRRRRRRCRLLFKNRLRVGICLHQVFRPNAFREIFRPLFFFAKKIRIR